MTAFNIACEGRIPYSRRRENLCRMLLPQSWSGCGGNIIIIKIFFSFRFLANVCSISLMLFFLTKWLVFELSALYFRLHS